MTPERLQEIIHARNLYGPANCWTGDTGKLATMIDELLKEIERLKNELRKLPSSETPAAS